MVQVKIYTTTTCPYCKMEKEYLDARGIKYENVFVDQDSMAAEDLMKMEGQFGVPFTVFTKDDGSSETLLGFDKAKLNEVLKIS